MSDVSLDVTGDLSLNEGDVTVINEQFETVTLQPNDILHVRVGIADMGDGSPWIPSPEDLEVIKEEWTAIAPEARVIVTHYGVEAIIIPTEPTVAEVSPYERI